MGKGPLGIVPRIQIDVCPSYGSWGTCHCALAAGDIGCGWDRVWEGRGVGEPLNCAWAAICVKHFQTLGWPAQPAGCVKRAKHVRTFVEYMCTPKLCISAHKRFVVS